MPRAHNYLWFLSALVVAFVVLPVPSQAVEPTSMTLNRDELMPLVFPTWKWGPDYGSAPPNRNRGNEMAG